MKPLTKKINRLIALLNKNRRAQSRLLKEESKFDKQLHAAVYASPYHQRMIEVEHRLANVVYPKDN